MAEPYDSEYGVSPFFRHSPTVLAGYSVIFKEVKNMTQAEKQAIIKEYATHEGDTGSPKFRSLFSQRELTTLTHILKTI